MPSEQAFARIICRNRTAFGTLFRYKIYFSIIYRLDACRCRFPFQTALSEMVARFLLY
ncbi:hypothetical protein [Neisseria maigaei]|uniref:hypothetical protein n=1 Tax=Neisseria maigaei TaxID=2830651 RepID=UPI002658FAE1|nr:hypothetical protein [Neisseria maigaei]